MDDLREMVVESIYSSQYQVEGDLQETSPGSSAIVVLFSYNTGGNELYILLYKSWVKKTTLCSLSVQY